MADTQPLLEQKPVGRRPIWNPRTLSFRMLMLPIIGLSCFGLYFSFDEIEGFGGSWTDPSNKDYLCMTSKQFSVLYAAYSWPNVILAFFGGLFAHQVGMYISSLIFGFCVFLGTFIVSLAPEIAPRTNVWPIMVVGRVFLGIGGESLGMMQNTMLALWFSDTEYLSMVFGIALTISRAGDFVAIFFGPIVTNITGTYKSWLWIGTYTTAMSLMLVFFYVVLDGWSERHWKKGSSNNSASQQFKWYDIIYFDKRFWLISLICMSYYVSITVFLSQSSAFLAQKYFPDNMSKSSMISSTITLTAMVLAPFLGKIIDLAGHRPHFILAGALFLIPSHALLLFGDDTFLGRAIPILPFISIGVTLSLVPGALWPSIPLLIQEEYISTAYGTMISIQNLGSALFSPVSGSALENGTDTFIYLFLAIDATTAFFSIILLILDHRNGRGLCHVCEISIPEDISDDEYFPVPPTPSDTF